MISSSRYIYMYTSYYHDIYICIVTVIARSPLMYYFHDAQYNNTYLHESSHHGRPFVKYK